MSTGHSTSRKQPRVDSPPPCTTRPKKPRAQSPPARPSARSDTKEAPQSNLDSSGAFVWRKKLDHQKKAGITVTEASEHSRRLALQDELCEAQRQRSRRDAERAEWENQQASQARMLEQQLNGDWSRQEASFDGRQHFARQAIRLRARRPRAADLLAAFVRLDLQDTDAADIDRVLDNIPSEQLAVVADAIEDELDFVADYPTDLDNARYNRALRLDFWICARSIVRSRLSSSSSADGVHSSVRDDVEQLFRGKTLAKLRDLEAEISARLQPARGDGSEQAADPALADPDFWALALVRVRVLIAQTRLRQLAGILRDERRVLEAPTQTARRAVGDGDDGAGAASGGGGGAGGEEADAGKDAPKDEDLLRAEAAKGMKDGEEVFADEVAPKPKSRDLTPGYSWNDRFRPRKPRYFNRVHTGYSWTTYNRTHYDHDNPPPKTVQGYKFNIFYPDLLDRSRTPTFHISKTENAEVCIITFRATAPYEDIAFKIVNRPWERSHRRGYRCAFDKGVLQLWFNFQRYRYRR